MADSTVVGMFADAASARRALADLETQGLPRGAADLVQPDDITNEPEPSQLLLTFLKRNGIGEGEAASWEAAVRQGRALLVVRVPSDGATAVAAALTDLGASAPPGAAEVADQAEPAASPAATTMLTAFEDGVYELPETYEQLEVTKVPHVVEEVVVERVPRQRVQRIRETLRRTEVQIEDLR